MANILITGASSGIGAATARQYAEPGAKLFLLGRDRARLNQVVDECRAKGAEAEAIGIDARDREAMRKTLLEIDARAPLDVVFANAGISTGLPHGAIAEDPQAVRAIVDINFLGVMNAVEPLIIPFCERGGGIIAITGSISALRALPHCPSYCATKAGVHLYAQSLRAGLARYGVLVSLVVPGFVSTPLNEKLISKKPMAMTAEQAAKIIRRGLDRRRATIAFPKLLYWGVRLLNLLPYRLVDAILAREYVDVPVTSERAATRALE